MLISWRQQIVRIRNAQLKSEDLALCSQPPTIPCRSPPHPTPLTPRHTSLGTLGSSSRSQPVPGPNRPDGAHRHRACHPPLHTASGRAHGAIPRPLAYAGTTPPLLGVPLVCQDSAMPLAPPVCFNRAGGRASVGSRVTSVLLPPRPNSLPSILRLVAPPPDPTHCRHVCR